MINLSEIALGYLRKTYCVEVMIINFSTEVLFTRAGRKLSNVYQLHFLEVFPTRLNVSVFHYILAMGTILISS